MYSMVEENGWDSLTHQVIGSGMRRLFVEGWSHVLAWPKAFYKAALVTHIETHYWVHANLYRVCYVIVRLKSLREGHYGLVVGRLNAPSLDESFHVIA